MPASSVDMGHLARHDDECVHAHSGHRPEGAVKLGEAVRFQKLKLHPQRPGGNLHFSDLSSAAWLDGIPEDRHAGGLWNCLLEELQTFAG